MLNEAFLTQMSELLGDELSLYLAQMKQPPVRGLRVTPGRTTAQALAQALGISLTPLSYEPYGYRIESEEKLGNHPLHHAGAFYLQEPSAMTPVAAAPLTEGMRVLDLCASPGGKSGQILSRIGETGCLVSNEINPSRCATLAGNMERLGYRNVIVTNTDSEAIGKHLVGYFDAILVDAPCSGEGMFRKNPDAVKEWRPDSPDLCARRSLAILSDIDPALRDGGYLIYSTCTFSIPENEGLISEFLKTHPNYTLEEIPDAVQAVTKPGYAPACAEGVDPARLRRFYPHTGAGEGQFLAVLKKRGDGRAEAPRAPQACLSRDEATVCSEYLTDTLAGAISASPIRHKDNITLPPLTLPLPEKWIYANGVTLGAIRKGRLIPHHSFFSAYGELFRRKLELRWDDPRTDAYLHGDTVAAPLDDGWAVVTVEGIPLGGVKVSGGVAKNHYPKGLRRML